MADNIKIKIDIALDPSGVDKGAAQTQARLDKLADAMTAAFNKTADAERKVTDESKKLDEQKKKLGDTLGNVANKIGAYNLAWQQGYNALVAATGAVKDYIKESALLNARYETMGVVLEVVGRNAGYSRTEMAMYTAEVEKSGITMIAARESVVKMVQANMDLNNASKLARVAQDAAVIANINSSQAFERLIYAIQSGQPEMLRTMGINVQFEAGYKAMAKQLGVTTDQLTELEKVQSRTNTTMEGTIVIAGVYEIAMTTAQKKINSLDRYTQNLKVQLGETWNEALVIAVDSYTAALKGVNDETSELTEKKKLQEWGREVLTTFAWVGDALAGAFAVFAQSVESAGVVVLQSLNAISQAALLLPVGSLTNWAAGDPAGKISRFTESFTAQANANLAARLARPQLRNTLEKFLAEKDRETGLRDRMKADSENELARTMGIPDRKKVPRPGTGKSGKGGSDWSQREDQMYKNQVAAAKELEKLDKDRIKSQEDEIRLFDKQMADWDRNNKQLEQQAQHWKDIVDPMEPYRRKIEEINNLWSQGKLTTEEWAISVQSVEDAVDKLGKKVKEKDPFEDMRNSIEGWGRDFSKTMGEAVVTFDFSMDKMGNAFKSLLSDIAAQLIQRQFTDKFVGWATGAIGSAFGGTWKSGDALHDGGVAGIDGTPRMVPAGAFAGARRMHAGGLAANEVPMILERGEEVLTRRDPRHRYNQGAGPTTFAPAMVFNVENKTSQPVQVKQNGPAMMSSGQLVVNLLLEELGNSPAARNALSGALG
jgi:hypothetical protein